MAHSITVNAQGSVYVGDIRGARVQKYALPAPSAVPAGVARQTPAGMSISEWDIREGDLSGSASRALVRLHLEGMHAHSPPGSVFALDFTGLTAPGVTVWTIWSDAAIAGMGALKYRGDRAGELKSMRTHPRFLRRGAAPALLEHVIAVSRTRGLERPSQTTGAARSTSFCT